ncbi:MAG: CheR family methyltransferase, partial [Thermodesulfobacteriota bacterium]
VFRPPLSRYKAGTIIRRLQRRIQALQLDTVAAYVARLRRDPAELDFLFKDFLIGVTHFFRDPKAFAALARDVVPQLFADKGTDDQVRVWVAGCASGEEAYSLAILLREYVATLAVAPRVQVFATDIDESAVAVARSGPGRRRSAPAPPRPSTSAPWSGGCYWSTTALPVSWSPRRAMPFTSPAARAGIWNRRPGRQPSTSSTWRARASGQLCALPSIRRRRRVNGSCTSPCRCARTAACSLSP